MHITVLMLQCLVKFFSLSLVFCLFITTEQRKILEKRKVLMHNFLIHHLNAASAVLSLLVPESLVKMPYPYITSALITQSA